MDNNHLLFKNNDTQGWTVVNYQKPPKKTPTPKKYYPRPPPGLPLPNINNRPTSPVQPASVSFEQGSHYIPFEQKSRSVSNELRLSGSGDQIPYSTKEHRGSKTEKNGESNHQRLVSKDLSRKIVQYRKNNSMTQQQLAIKLDIKLEVVQDYEKGTAISDKVANSKFHQLISKK